MELRHVALLDFAFVFVLPAQFGLFLVMWWANVRRMETRDVEKAADQAADQHRRQERARLAREQVDPNWEAEHTARAAKAEAGARERQERVRRVREEREREERERATKEQAERNRQRPGA
jgi:hypothetical protein